MEEAALAKLELSARVAHGGMASIHLATDARGRRVAVKVLHAHLAEDPHMRRMFLHEARLAERLAHPNVVRVYGHGDDPRLGAYLVMEYVRGADLAGVLKAASARRRRVDPRVVCRLLVDVCRGLHAAHGLRGEDGEPLHLVHRDVSPHNVLVGDDGVARLTDFGIAKSDERYTLTRPGQLKGKLSYMAPEQLAQEDDTDQRADVFAAGVVLWEEIGRAHV
jgi:eukaryotic-like serine/threonine-protein kinase